MIKSLIIHESSITLSLSVSNLLSIQDLTIPIKSYSLAKSNLIQKLVIAEAQSCPIDEVIENVIHFYKSDIISN